MTNMSIHRVPSAALLVLLKCLSSLWQTDNLGTYQAYLLLRIKYLVTEATYLLTFTSADRLALSVPKPKKPNMETAPHGHVCGFIDWFSFYLELSIFCFISFYLKLNPYASITGRCKQVG